LRYGDIGVAGLRVEERSVQFRRIHRQIGEREAHHASPAYGEHRNPSSGESRNQEATVGRYENESEPRLVLVAQTRMGATVLRKLPRASEKIEFVFDKAASGVQLIDG
jgi:hypothetical protein